MITYEDLNNWRAPCGSRVLHMPHESAFRVGHEISIVSNELGDRLYGCSPRVGNDKECFFGVTVRDGVVRTVFVYDWRRDVQAAEVEVEAPHTMEDLEAWLKMTIRLMDC